MNALPAVANTPLGQSPAASFHRQPSPVRWMLLALLSMLGLLAYLVYTQYREAEIDAATMTRNLVEVLESRLSNDFAQTGDALAFLARRVSEADLRPTLSAREKEAIRRQLTDLEKSFPEVGGLTIFDADGRLRHSSEPTLKNVSIADRAHFKMLRDDPKANIAYSEAQIARTTGSWSIVIVRPLRDERGRFFGTLNAVIAIDSISKLFGSIDVGPGGVTLMRRSDNSKLVQRMPRNNEKDFNQPLPPNNPIRERIEAGERSGTLTLIASTDGIERLASFKMMDNAPFYIQVAIAKDHYLASWKAWASGVAGLAAILITGFGLLLRQVRKSAASAAAADAARREVAHRHASLIAASPAGIWQTDTQGANTFVSSHWCQITGIPEDAALGAGWSSGLHPDDRERIYAGWVETARTDARDYLAEFRFVHPDGRIVWVQCQAVADVDAGGQVTGWVGTITDITALKRAEVSIRESEAFVQGVLNSVNSQIAVIDAAGTLVAINKAWREFSQENSHVPGEMAPNTDIGTNYLAICQADFRTGTDEALTAHDGIVAVLEGRLPSFSLEYPCPSPEEQRWFRLNVTPLAQSGGPGAVVVHDNITASKLAGLALAEKQQRLANILWGTGVGTWEWNVQTGETRFNERWAEIVGYRLEELAPVNIETWARLAHPDDLVRSGELAARHFSGEADHYECEARMRHKDGHWIWVLDRGKVVSRTPDGKPEWMAGTHWEITERKAIEESLRNSEKLLKEAQRMAMIGSWELNLSSNQLTWSDEIFRIFEIDKSQFGASYEAFLSAIHPEDREAVNAAYVGSLNTRAPYAIEHRLLFADGRVKHVREQCETTFGDTGQALRSAGTVQDITERKHSEHELQERTAALSRSNAELEQFAYVASHDLRQPLRMVNSYVQLLERRLAEKLDGETTEMMHFATDGAKRMDQMLVSLLDYSRVGRKGEPLAPLASRDGVDEALRFLAPAIRDADATVLVSGDWPELVASRDEFTRLWQNLIGNAVKYRAPDRVPEIDITVMPVEAGWRFCVADNGIGIDPTQFDRLFKVFQRLHTRDQYEGTGIGLAVARKIVERHGGRIWVESGGNGQGCRFCFNLPKWAPVEVAP
jgi:PAS domain S-box-containing protein